ncbi:MAG: hypothetical protein EXS12_09265 [Phycisphaerales bacterium]|nr:hypothetical protein [Phycisphaerales bacterium]
MEINGSMITLAGRNSISCATPALNGMAAARVPVAPDPFSAPLLNAGPDRLQLYTRAADRIEVATGMARGRLLNIQA